MSQIETDRKIELKDETYKDKNKHYLYLPQARVAYIWEQFKKTGKGGRSGKIKSIYVAFDNIKQCREFEETMKAQYGVYRVKARGARRVLDWEYEVKIQGDFSIEEIKGIMLHVEAVYPEKTVVTGEGSYRKELKIRPISAPRQTEFRRISTVIEHAQIGNWQLVWFANLSKEQRRSRALFC
ncbi:MAG: hypothetical protein F6K14_26770 [Symploca sp. SIO2C1]|nr:hypothetical protein [Symploca sp. SIO2C1]